MDLLARDAGDRFIARFIGLHFLGGPALHMLARVRAAIKEWRHCSTQADLRLRGLSYVKKPEQGNVRTKKMAPVFGASFRWCLLFFGLVATALLARNHAAIVTLNGRGHHPAVLPWADGYAARANADSGVSITSVAVAIIPIPPELNIDLGHLEVLGIGRSGADKQRGRHQHCSRKRRGKSNLCHGLLLGLIQTEGVSTDRKGFALHSVSFSSRVHIMASGNCLGFVASLLKLLEKVSHPRGERLLDNVVLTETLPDYPLNIAR
jgi:hypothetical protein